MVYPPYSLLPPALTTRLSMSMTPFSFLLNPATPNFPPPLAAILLSTYESVPIFLVSAVYSLDPTYECNHMVFAFF